MDWGEILNIYNVVENFCSWRGPREINKKTLWPFGVRGYRNVDRNNRLNTNKSAKLILLPLINSVHDYLVILTLNAPIRYN